MRIIVFTYSTRPFKPPSFNRSPTHYLTISPHIPGTWICFRNPPRKTYAPHEKNPDSPVAADFPVEKNMPNTVEKKKLCTSSQPIIPFGCLKTLSSKNT